jgi:predicted N-acetyltransferase YhbS
MIMIREETIADVEGRERLLDESFGPGRFAKTSERLREVRLPSQGLAFVVTLGCRVVGTVRLWDVNAGPGRSALLLGPLAVDPAFRSHGIGAKLMDHAIDRAKALGHRAILLVGDAPYYARFGFSNAATGGLVLPGPVDRTRFLALELRAGALAGAFGSVVPTGERTASSALRAAASAAALGAGLRKAA